MRKTLALLLLLGSVAALADPADEVRRAETAFAKAFADRDEAAFFTFVPDDATFLSPRGTLAGKPEIVRVWSGFFKAKTAPFSWRPERVVTNAAGTVGLSTGPVFNAEGDQIGIYSSVWQKNAAGEWKVQFDGPGAPPAVEEGFITTPDGIRLHYRKIGGGPNVVIVPFATAVFESMRPLARVATVISYDMRSRGRSDRSDDRVSIEQDVEDLETVRRHFHIDRFVPIGYSYLGQMVALYALAHPERVERLVQLGPVPIDADAKFEAHTDDDVAAPADDVKRWRELQANAAAPQNELCEAQWRVRRYGLVGDPAHVANIADPCAFENEYPAHLSTVFSASFASIKKRHLTHEQVKTIAVPVLTIHGTWDRNAPYEGGKDWAATLPNARLLTLDRVAHASFADAPDAVIGAILTFLDGGWPKDAVRVE